MPDEWVVVGLDNGGNTNNATVLTPSGEFLVDSMVESPSRVLEGADVAVEALTRRARDTIGGARLIDEAVTVVIKPITPRLILLIVINRAIIGLNPRSPLTALTLTSTDAQSLQRIRRDRLERLIRVTVAVVIESITAHLVCFITWSSVIVRISPHTIAATLH